MNILWSLDPFLINKDLEKKAKKIFKSLFTTEDSLKAVYVASNREVNLATAYNIPRERRYSDYPEKMLKRTLQRLGLKKVQSKVLTCLPGISLGTTVKMLSQYAQKEDVDLVVMASNARKTLPRLVLGSFAETFIHLSKNDVLVYHQKTRLDFDIPRKIIFGHDFSTKGAAGLMRAILYARKWKAELIVVHVLRSHFDHGPKARKVQEIRQRMVRQSLKLEEQISAEGVHAKVEVIDTPDSIASTLMSFAKKEKANIMMTAAKSSNLSSFLGGDVTRKILRESQLLTIVIKV